MCVCYILTIPHVHFSSLFPYLSVLSPECIRIYACLFRVSDAFLQSNLTIIVNPSSFDKHAFHSTHGCMMIGTAIS